MLELGRPRRCRSRSATSAGSARCSTTSAADVLVLFFSGGHYRQPLAFSDETPRGRAARGRADPRGRAPAGRRALAGGAGVVSRRVLRGAAQRLQHRRGAGFAVRLGARGEPLRGARSGDAHLREMLDVLGLEGLLAAEEGPPAEAVALADAARGRARRDRDWAEADRLRDELRALGWEVRDGPDGPELVRDVMSGASRRTRFRQERRRPRPRPPVLGSRERRLRPLRRRPDRPGPARGGGEPGRPARGGGAARSRRPRRVVTPPAAARDPAARAGVAVRVVVVRRSAARAGVAAGVVAARRSAARAVKADRAAAARRAARPAPAGRPRERASGASRAGRAPGDFAPAIPEGAVTARRMVIYGRNPVREALRGRRRVHRVWATEPAAAEGWAPAQVTVVSAEEIEERVGSDAHQGVCALVDPYPLRGRGRAAARCPTRCSWRSTRSPIRRTSARSRARPRSPAPPA